ncbi:MAG: glycosyltransferase family 2 protein [Candidatus Omnitrophica bacterium]|nr:glycosyltransferase family 2 protein [Candidatus Omnitrophota bacterium]MBU1996010.1 glycosyltransferase family 2 protein [Candidatus Omnitrophota bacterium]MBU4334541.1 glycosyltransferase family 2 protein [Candidatus Omnitrophota bacterium]
MEVSIVIPIYNSKNLVEKAIRSIVRYMESLCVDYEILLRDDGSTDGSCEILKMLSQGFEKVRYFENGTNRGLGFTLKRLFEDAKGDNVVYCDCDLPFGEKVIKVLLKELQNSDIIVASRYMGKKNQVGLIRKTTSRAYYFLCRLLFKIRVSDIGSGSVAFRKNVLDEINLAGEGFVFHIEIFKKALEKGFSIKEIPFEARGWQRGSFGIIKHGMPTFIDTLKLKFNRL